jgi:hypothetical protein
MSTTASIAGHSTTAQVHGLVDQKLLEEEERNRSNGTPLI